MLKRLFWLIIGILIGFSSILYIYGDLNGQGIKGLYSTYQNTKQKQKEADDKLVKEYMEKSMKLSKEAVKDSNTISKVNNNKKNTIKKEMKKENKWAKQIKHTKKDLSYVIKEYKNLDGTPIKESQLNNMNNTLLTTLPYKFSGDVAISSSGKTPDQIKSQERINVKNILRLKDEIGYEFNYIFVVRKREFLYEFNEDPVRLLNQVKKDFPGFDYQIWVKKDDDVSELKFNELPLSYMFDEPYSKKYIEQMVWINNNQNYKNKDLFPMKYTYFSSTSPKNWDESSLKYYENLLKRKLTDSELNEEPRKDSVRYRGYKSDGL